MFGGIHREIPRQFSWQISRKILEEIPEKNFFKKFDNISGRILSKIFEEI